jgi:pyridoxal phosphate enzyme (YggS family)
VAAGGLSAVRAEIAAAATRAGRSPEEITLVAVTKGRSPEQVLAAYDAGHRDFGENRAQELLAKSPGLPADIRWHFVGRLQRNKARKVAAIAGLLHSLDSARLAAAWAGASAPPPALVQVNVGREPQKGGVAVGEAEELVLEATELGVDVRGLMTVAPLVEHSEQARPIFAELAALRDRIAARVPSCVELSMGMTDDYGVAIEEGATVVRVGRAIFGPSGGPAGPA